MSENYKDILSNLSTEVDQETLLLYLQGKLSEEKKHEVEKHLLQSEFEEEALEGLEDFKDKEQLQYMVEMLNRDLKKKTEKKKKRREKMNIKDQPWLYISILILILLIALSYMFITRLLKNN
jgi:predicted anti-sigma-YlaC factor YlaD